MVVTKVAMNFLPTNFIRMPHNSDFRTIVIIMQVLIIY